MKNIFFVGILFTVFSCGGTGVGNPGLVTTNGASDNTASAMILSDVCNLLVSCSGGLTLSSCLTGVQNTSGIETTVGLASGSYANYGSIESAELAGAIHPDQSAAALCESQIGLLSCSNSAVRNAYQPGLPNPFINVAGMMPASPGSCGSVF
jgi:hypothetical protein